MGCSDSSGIPVQSNYPQQIIYYQQPYANQNVVYQQYPQNNVNYVNTPNQPVYNTNTPNNYTGTNNTNNVSKVNNVNINQKNNYNNNSNNNASKINTNVENLKPKENTQIQVSQPVIKTPSERVVKESDNFEDKDYTPIFKSDLYDKEVQTITKVFSDLRDDDDDPDSQGKIHHIYVTLNYRDNCIDIIEIDKALSTEYKKHLKVIKIENECSIERAKPFLEKYNTEFGVDSTKWYEKNKTTNIYVKSEIDPNKFINMFEIFYDKSNCSLIFNRKRTDTNFNFNGTPITADASVLVTNYNLLKSDFTIDHAQEEIPKNNSNNNNNFFNNFGNMNKNFPNNISSQKIKSKGNGVSIENNLDLMNNFFNCMGNMGNMGNNFGNGNGFVNCTSFQTGFNLNQKIEIELPKQKQGGGGSRQKSKSKSNKNNDGYSRVYGDEYGTMRNQYGDIEGKFSDGGTIRDEYGERMGQICGSVIRDANGERELEVTNGVVRDANGNRLGEISNGVVKDYYGYEIGRAEGLSDEQAAYKYFFKK